MGCQQCLPLSVVQLKGKHYRKPHCHNGVVDTFGPGLFEIDSTPIMCVLFWVSTYLLVFQCCWLVLILSGLAASTICIMHMIWIFAFWYAQKLCLEAIKPHGNPRIVITLIYTIEWAAIYLPTCCSVARFKHSYYSRSHVRLWPRWIVSKALLQ